MAAQSSQSPAKPEFWRVKNIKIGEKEAAREWLERQVQELDLPDGQGYSLAVDSEISLCATLTSFERPTPPMQSWFVAKDFIGFTPLYSPEDAHVDIVAVTGLGGHALGSFRSAKGVSVWLRDFAPEDIPQARFITYGYDTAVVESDSNQGIYQLAHTFLDRLAVFRRNTQTQKRPLCFMGHSLGGIVLKQALIISSKATEAKDRELQQLVSATYGLVLMGVPNLGLQHKQLETVVKGRPNRGFVRDLLVQSDGEPSQYLDNLARDFVDLDKRRRPAFVIVSYYERISSPTVIATPDGRFTMNGPKEFMVTKASAERISYYFRDIDHFPSQADHRGLVRFENRHDDRYRDMIEKLKRMAAEAATSVRHFVTEEQQGATISNQPGETVSRYKYLPFRSNRQFVGRSTELQLLEEKLFVKQDCQVMAVVGLGGIGKTQVVLHFAYSVLKNHPDVSVFWVPALSAEMFEQAYREIAKVLQLRIMSDGKEDIKELVKRHLDARTGGKWLLVVDNADDMDILDGINGNPGLDQYLPEADTGLILYTTRSLKIAQSLSGSDTVHLDKMTEREAEEMLRQSLFSKDLLLDKTLTTNLLVELDYLPLAITQATAYMNCNKVSLSTYLDLLHTSEQDMVSVMSEAIRDKTRYRQAANAVSTTWLISFQQIIKSDSNAADLLQYMACIEWKAIPHSILPAVQPVARMTSAIGALCAYSFLTRRDGGNTYDMHRLVHLAARIWMEERGSLAEIQQKAIQHLSDVFPPGDYSNRKVWREYLPHAARISKNKQYGDLETAAELWLKAGLCLLVDGRTTDAVEWLERSRDCRAQLSEDHPFRLASQHALAVAYQANGQVKEAARMLEYVVAIRERVLVEDHPSRLASQHELAVVYQANGRVKEAVQILEHVVAIQERTLVEDHPNRVASQHVLAVAYQANGQLKEAVRILEHVVAIKERALIEDHPDRLSSQHALAVAYQANGQVEEAMQILEYVVAIRERTLTEDHPNRLASQHELARAYQANGQVKETVRMLEHVVAIQGRALAKNHPSRLTSQHVLAGAYQANGQVKEAVRMLEQVVAIQERTLVEDHPSRLASQHELARAYRVNRQVKEAVRMLEHVVAIQERTLVEDHPSRLASQHELAVAYQANRQVKEAMQILEHVVVFRERTLVEDHPDRLASQHELARAYQANGQVKEAVRILEHAVAIKERALIEDHPDRLASQHALAVAYQANGQVEEAVQILEHVVAIQERTLVEDHPNRLASQDVLAVAYQANGQVEEAVRILEYVVAIQERTLAEDHPDRLALQHELARLYKHRTN